MVRTLSTWVLAEWHLLRQAIPAKHIIPTKHIIRHSDEGRNPEKQPPLVHMDPGLRRDDGAFKLKDGAFKLKDGAFKLK